MYISICGVSDRGYRREDNQDAMLVGGIIEKSECYLKLPVEGYFLSNKGLLCAVADGMGGHRGGNEASLLTLQTLAESEPVLFATEESEAICLKLKDVVVAINKKVLIESKAKPDLAAMGSTLTGIYLRPNRSLYYHVGDSRLYRYRGNYLTQLTEDHTLESLRQRATGEITTGVKQGVVTSCIGGDTESCKVGTGEINFVKNDLLLLCTDGLSDMLSIEKIEEIIACRCNLLSLAHNLVLSAKKAGGNDNITVLIVEIS